MFRSLKPRKSPKRYFPNLSDVATGGSPAWEVLPAKPRDMEFKVTVRDRGIDEMLFGCADQLQGTLKVTVDNNGPFTVLTPNGGETFGPGEEVDVKWTTNTTSFCDNVNIRLAVEWCDDEDADCIVEEGELGPVFSYLLAANVPNSDGIYTVTMPALPPPPVTVPLPPPSSDYDKSRIMVECADKQSIAFFDISDDDFTIKPCPPRQTAYIGGEVSYDGGNTGKIYVSVYNLATFTLIPSQSLTFSWTGPNGFTSSSQHLSGLPPGEYCLEVFDRVTGCLVASRCFSVCGNLILGIKHNGFIECEGELGTFEVMLDEQHVTPPYTIQWSNGATSAVNEGLPPGNYCVTVTDANDCTSSMCLNMYVKYPIEIAGTVQDDGCGDQNGSIDLTVNAQGSQVKGYIWSNGATTADIDNLASGEYCVTVTNQEGCEETECFNVGSQEIQVGLINLTNPFLCTYPPCLGVQEVTCSSDGAISISVQTSLGTATVTWSGPNGFSAQGTSIANLPPGTYTATIQAGNCTIEESFTLSPCAEEEEAINEDCEMYNTSFNFNSPSGTVQPVENGCDGSIMLDYSSSGLTFSWTGPNGYLSTSKNISQLCEGTYCVTVSNGCGIEKSACFDIVDCNTQNLSVAGSTANSCPGYSAGAVLTAVSGGAAPYQYQWSNGANTQNLNGVSSGQYCVTVTDKNGCKANGCFVVGSESTTSSWNGCTNVISCRGVSVSETSYPTIIVPDPVYCNRVRVICSATNVVVGNPEVDLVLEILGNCTIAEVNPVTGQTCKLHYGERIQQLEGGCTQPNPDICPISVACNLVTYCVFPTLDVYYVEAVENWLQIGVVGVPPNCFRQYYCRFEPEPLCQCPAPCGGLLQDGSDLLSQNSGVDEIRYFESALKGIDLNDEAVLLEYQAEAARRLKEANSDLGDLIANPRFLLTDAVGEGTQEPAAFPVDDHNERIRFNVYPNPMSDQLTVEANLNQVFEELQISIFDLLGKKVYGRALTPKLGVNTWRLDEVSVLPNGLYVLQISAKNENIFVQKLVLQK